MAGAALHQPQQAQVDFDALRTSPFYLLHNENIISSSVSEAVEKIPTDEKDYRKCSFVVYFAQPQQLQRVDQHIAS